jgi:small subunit ribosomal protein S16
MALRIRLRQQGSNNRAFYRIVVANARSPRDGKYVEALGWYNPLENDADKSISVKQDRIQHWVDFGAQISENVESLLNRAAPELVRRQKDKEVAHRAKKLAKRKARAKAN